jgi:ATP-dependent DNA helicase RecG
MEVLRLSHRPSFLYSYLQPAIAAGFVEMTIPDKPQSSRQQYRITRKGRDLIAKLAKEEK